MKTISENSSSLIVIKKSKFYGFLIKCDSLDNFNKILFDFKKKYFDATHICYSYIINENDNQYIKAYDDGEPSKTAGAPMLNVLSKNSLENVVAISVRYFGGTLLGTGGLTQAYTNSILEALSKTKIESYSLKYLYEITFSYENKFSLENVLNKYIVISKKYDLDITYALCFDSIIKYDEFIKNNSHLIKSSKYISKKYIKEEL